MYIQYCITIGYLDFLFFITLSLPYLFLLLSCFCSNFPSCFLLSSFFQSILSIPSVSSLFFHPLFPFFMPSHHAPSTSYSPASFPPYILFTPPFPPILRPGCFPGCWGSRLMCHAGDCRTASSIAALPALLSGSGVIGSGMEEGLCRTFLWKLS